MESDHALSFYCLTYFDARQHIRSGFPDLKSLGSNDLAGLVGETLSQSKATQELLTQFTSQFPLSPQQAGGGVATLLAQAQNNLNADQKASCSN